MHSAACASGVMAMSDQRSIYQMRQQLDDSQFYSTAEELITSETVARFLHRDLDQLEAAAESCNSVVEMERELQTCHNSIKRWAQAYGVDIPLQDTQTMAHKLETLDGDAIGGD